MGPPQTPPDLLYRFEWGGLLGENLDMSRAVDVGNGTMLAVESLREEERTRLLALLQESAGRACVLADPQLRRGDSAIEKFYARTAVLAGDQVFHVLDQASAEDGVELAFASAPFWMDLRVVTDAPPSVGDGREITVDALRLSAASVVAISCSAYDGEGFVVWQRD